MKIKLGEVRSSYEKDNNNYVSGETIYLEKHSWNCKWYWGFGYVGNRDLHTHFNSVFLGKETDVNKIFSKTKITQAEWWLLRDLFTQAYALKNCAEVYRYGGHQTTLKGTTDIIQDKKQETRLNKDLEIVLNKIWSLLK